LGEGLWVSDDGGGNWTRILAGDFMRAVVVDLSDPNSPRRRCASASDRRGVRRWLRVGRYFAVDLDGSL